MAVPPLEALVAAGHDVALVVTGADKRRGRGSETSRPARSRRPRRGSAFRCHTTSTTCSAIGAELGVVVAFGRMIKPHVLARAADGQPALLAAAAMARGGARRARPARRRHGHRGVRDGGRGGSRHGRRVRPRRGADRARRRRSTSSATSWCTVGTRLLVDTLDGGLGEPEPQEGEVTYAAQDRSRRAPHRLVAAGRGDRSPGPSRRARGRRSAAARVKIHAARLDGDRAAFRPWCSRRASGR